jgi:phosphatidylglycerophosphate synthase
VSAATSKPSVAELRAAAQPPSIFARNSGEHWAGRLYVRKVSIHLTRALLNTPVTPNAMTVLMIVVGLGAAALLAIGGVLPAAGAVVLIQLQILLDCSDGELARWRRQFSPAGVYLDRLAHHVTETALPIGLGIGVDEPVLGLIAAVLSLLVRDEGDLVAVTRLELGLPKLADTAANAAPAGLLGHARRYLGAFPLFRAFIAVEASLLALFAAALGETRTLLIALVAIGAFTAVTRPLAILSSRRLRS